jgi:hypothetical protein
MMEFKHAAQSGTGGLYGRPLIGARNSAPGLARFAIGGSTSSRVSFPSSPAPCCARVASKQELKDRIIAAMDFFNREPVVHTWTHKLDRAV